MAKILVEDPEEQTKVPFLRGILIRSLQDAGLSFKEAYRFATDIRNELGDVTHITSHALHKMVLKRLQATRGDTIANRYVEHNLPLTIMVEQRDGQLTPFSRLEYQHCLETIGLEGNEASNFVTLLNKHLTDRHIQRITSRRLGMLTYRYLRQSRELGPAVAQRWMVWRDYAHSGRPMIFLIGGTVGCGKSTTATMLANRLDIVRTQSTDMLREVMRTMLPKQLMPVLHTSSFTAWTALPGHPEKGSEVSDAQLIHGYRSQADLLSVAIEAVIQRALRERVSLILEGVHINPAFVEKLKEKLGSSGDQVLVPIMLGVLKRKWLQGRIRGRGTNVPQRRSERYLVHFDEIWRLQSYLLSEADRANIPIVVNSDRNKVFSEIMRITIEKLQRNFTGSPQEVFS
jgi:2-phosphoglycerate kinase